METPLTRAELLTYSIIAAGMLRGNVWHITLAATRNGIGGATARTAPFGTPVYESGRQPAPLNCFL